MKTDISVLLKRDLKGRVLYWIAISEPFGLNIYYGRLDTMDIDNMNPMVEKTGLSKVLLKRETELKLNAGYIKVPIEFGEWIDIKTSMIHYSPNVPFDLTDINGLPKPMKAVPKKFKKDSEELKFNFPAMSQDKINGVRMNARLVPNLKQDVFDTREDVVKITSHNGIVYNIKHLEKVLYPLFIELMDKGYYDFVLDGEVYIPYANVTTIGGAARNPDNPRHKELQIVLYDLAVSGIVQEDRINILYDLNLDVHSNSNTAPTVFMCHTEYTYDTEQAFKQLEVSLARDYEGLILRDLQAEYQFGRRRGNMMKLKKFEDAEFEVIDIVEYGNRPRFASDNSIMSDHDVKTAIGYGCKFILKNNINNLTFESDAMGTAFERSKYVDNKSNIIGKMVTVKFYERTKNGLPFHTNVIGVRDYE